MLEFLSTWCRRNLERRRSYIIHQQSELGTVSITLSQLCKDGTWRRSTLLIQEANIGSIETFQLVREATVELRRLP